MLCWKVYTFYLWCTCISEKHELCLLYEVSKAFPCGRQVVHKHKMLYHKKENFSFIHIQLIFLGEILTPNEVNGNVAIDFVWAGIWLLKFVSSYLQESQKILVSFSQTPTLLTAYCPSFTNCPSGRKKAVYLQTHFAFPLRTRPQRHLLMSLPVCTTCNFQVPALSNLQPLASIWVKTFSLILCLNCSFGERIGSFYSD